MTIKADLTPGCGVAGITGSPSALKDKFVTPAEFGIWSWLCQLKGLATNFADVFEPCSPR